MSLLKKLKSEISEEKSKVERNVGQISVDKRHLLGLDKDLTDLQNQVRSLTASHVPVHGIDVSWANPNPAAVLRAGFDFIVRYYSLDPSKNLTPHDAESYSESGLYICTTWESQQFSPLGGYATGVIDGKNAYRQSVEAKQPKNSPIYFAVDFELTETERENTEAYFKGCIDVLGLHRVGVYGGLSTIRLISERKLASYFWQTLAWSGTPTVWYPRAQLRQVQVETKVAGMPCDINMAVTPNYGQWRV